MTVEETFELAAGTADTVAMQCRQPSLEGTGEITLRRLIKEALRMRPDRIVVGEVREAESLDLLIALNSGLPGMSSIHANSARDALAKLCTLPLLAGRNIDSGFVVPAVAGCIDVVIHCELRGGHRRVAEIAAPTGRVVDGVVEAVGLFASRDGSLRTDRVGSRARAEVRRGRHRRARAARRQGSGMNLVLALLAAGGVLLAASPWIWPRRSAGRRGPWSPTLRARERLVQAGLGSVPIAVFVVASFVLGAIGFTVALAVTGVFALSLVVAVIAVGAPVARGRLACQGAEAGRADGVARRRRPARLGRAVGALAA